MVIVPASSPPRKEELAKKRLSGLPGFRASPVEHDIAEQSRAEQSIVE